MQKKRRRPIDKKAIAKAVTRVVATKTLTAMRTTPLGVMLAAGVIFSQAASLPAAFSSSIATISYMILVFGMTITACFNRSRFFFILIILLLSQLGMSSYIPNNSDKSLAFQSIFSAVSLLLPLNLLFFSSLSERGILSRWGQRNIAIIVVQMIFIMVLVLSGDGELLNGISGKFMFLSLMPPTPIPHSAVMTFAGTGILLLMKRRRATIHFKVTIFNVLLAIAFAHHFSSNPLAIPLFYAAAGLVIIVSVIQDYYYKAYLDELTALPSRRSLNEDIMKLDSVYVIAMVDIDFFKKINDTYGHDAGDDVLRFIARLIQECKNGKAYRYGGEEFTILFSGKRRAEVIPYLEELRCKIAQSKFVLRGEDKKGNESTRKLNVTVSIGVAEATHKSITPAEVIKAADQALYRAKDQGRNCVREG